MKPVVIKTRDGLSMNAYLTLPNGLAPKNLPMVLFVHGGPWARDGWGYNSDAQWFANRGYAVLQPNYRGSTGYGKKFLNAAIRQWGLKMHDDLIDAVELGDRGRASRTRRRSPSSAARTAATRRSRRPRSRRRRSRATSTSSGRPTSRR